MSSVQKKHFFDFDMNYLRNTCESVLLGTT